MHNLTQENKLELKKKHEILYDENFSEVQL